MVFIWFDSDLIGIVCISTCGDRRLCRQSMGGNIMLPSPMITAILLTCICFETRTKLLKLIGRMNHSVGHREGLASKSFTPIVEGNISVVLLTSIWPKLVPFEISLYMTHPNTMEYPND